MKIKQQLPPCFQQTPSYYLRKLLNRKFLVLFAPVLLMLAGCVSAPATDSAGGDTAGVPLSNTYWQLVKVGPEALPDAADERQPHILFLDNGRVRGFSGCNQYRGDYRVAGDNLMFDAMSSTRMACGGSQTEQLLFAAFARTVGVNLDGTRLRLLGENAQVLAEFKAVTRR
jgi:heat shock protein HslJ